MKKRNLLSTTLILAIICVALLAITSSFSDLGSQQESASVLLDDTDTDTSTDDTDTGTDDTDDSGSAPEAGMIFDKPVAKPVSCPAQSVTWTKSYTSGGSLISVVYSNKKTVQGPSWGSTVGYTITGSSVIPAFDTDWIKCVNKWSWGCDFCNATEACTVGCG